MPLRSASPEIRTCRACGRGFPLTREFWVERRNQPGCWHSGCRECRNRSKLASYHRKKTPRLPTTLVCAQCDTEFVPAATASGKTRFCSPLCRERERAPRRVGEKREQGVRYRAQPEVRETIRKRSAEWRANNPERLRASRLSYYVKWKYGITQDDYEYLLAEQDGRCAICRTDDPAPHKRLSIDHCHETGVVRGLLCHYCNIALGAAKDNPDTLRAAITYLERSR